MRRAKWEAANNGRKNSANETKNDPTLEFIRRRKLKRTRSDFSPRPEPRL